VHVGTAHVGTAHVGTAHVGTAHVGTTHVGTTQSPVTSTTDRAHASASAAVMTHDFEAVFLEHWPRVYGVLRRLVGDHAEAEDLALETFWQLYRRPPHDARDLNLGGWLYRVATNLGLNTLRAWKRREHYELEAGQWDAPHRGDTDPAEVQAQAEVRGRVRAVLGEMSPRQAQLLILRHSGMSYQELAAALGVSANSIGTLLVRAERDFEKRYCARYPEGE
jgi:RNA polymerase sigma-70 factor (ECF subfamily)